MAKGLNHIAGPLRQLVPVLALAACLTGPSLAIAQEQTVASGTLPVVKLAPVTLNDAQLRRVFFGKVVARETVDLAFQVGGQIVQFPVEEGATVARGSVVARMDIEPFELALEQAMANRAQAQRTVARYEKLAGTSVAETNLEDARTAVALNDIAVRNAKRDLDNAALHAPFDAIVAARMMPNFSTVSGGTPVVRLHDMSELRVEIEVPETLFQRAGRDPNVTFVANFPTSVNRYPMEIREYNAEAAEIGQTYNITLGSALPEDFVPLPGASVEVSAVLKLGGQSIEVPNSSVVIGNDNQTYVMVFEATEGGQGKVIRTPVEITPTERGKVAIKEGLVEGQEIVVSGASQLEDGADVRRFTGFGN